MKVYIIIFINEWLAVQNKTNFTSKADILIIKELAESKIIRMLVL
jgi:hypothetical protein